MHVSIDTEAAAEPILTASYDPKPHHETLSIVIVGGGIGGLVTALECHRRGFAVRILEKARGVSQAGNTFILNRSGLRWIQNYPEVQKDFRDLGMRDFWVQRRKFNGEPFGDPDLFWRALTGITTDEDPMRDTIPPVILQLRAKFFKILCRQLERCGLKVEFGIKVVALYEDELRGKAGVETSTGHRIEGDLVIAADGVNTLSNSIVNKGAEPEILNSGKISYRGSLPRSWILEHPNVEEVFNLKDGKYELSQPFVGASSIGVAFVLKDVISWGFVYDSGSRTNLPPSSYRRQAQIDPSAVVDKISQTQGFSKAFKDLVSLTPAENISAWPLVWRNPHPNWSSAGHRILQVGDSAHAFLPTAMNGATQAMEDAVTIATCLDVAGGHKNTVPIAVQAHNRLRYERVSCAQKYGFYNEWSWRACLLSPAEQAQKRKAAARQPRWLWKHDPEVYAIENYTDAAANITDGVPFTNTNIPAGHTFKAWSMQDLMRDMEEGRGVELDGDWS